MSRTRPVVDQPEFETMVFPSTGLMDEKDWDDVCGGPGGFRLFGE